MSVLAQNPVLVKDINPYFDSNSHDPEAGGVLWNGQFFYSGWASSNGYEPWVTNGTEEGTFQLMDIAIGATWSDPVRFTAGNDAVYFVIQGEDGEELWKTDGTQDGTKIVIDLLPDGDDNIGNLVFWNDLIYFASHSTLTDEEAIWRTDGTAEGTELFLDLDPDGGTGIGTHYIYNGDLIWWLYTSEYGSEPYITYADDESTVLLADLEDGSSSSGSTTTWAEFEDKLLFTNWTSNNGGEWYMTDGTPEGTGVFLDINFGSSSSSPASPTWHQDELYFTAIASNGRQLWKTDGTTDGTMELSNIEAWNTFMDNLTSVGDKLFFSAESDDYGAELYVSDGTSEGTGIYLDTNPGEDDGEVNQLYTHNGFLYFQAETPSDGIELWKLNPEDGTYEQWDLLAGSGDSYPFFFHDFEEGFFFYAADEFGYEPFFSDGTESGTVMLADINPEESAISTHYAITIGDNLIFIGRPADDNLQLYATNGTPEGTQAITNERGHDIVQHGEFVVYDDLMWFRANNEDNGSELWVTDGTEEGTYLHTDLAPGTSSGLPINMVALEDKLIFSGYTESESKILVLNEESGTVETFIDIWPGDDEVGNVTRAGDYAFFSARDTDDFGTGTDLWRTDGTASGTQKVWDFGTYAISPEKFFGFEDDLWFFGEQYGSAAVWGLYHHGVSSEANTYAANHNLSGNNFGSYLLEEFNGGVIYTIFLLSNGRELYFSDDSGENAYIVKNIGPGSSSPGIQNFIFMNDLAYFIAEDGLGTELWQSDATAIGTFQVTDFAEGSGVLNRLDGYDNIAELNGYMYFGASEDGMDYELYRTDGIGEFELVAEINTSGASNPHRFYATDNYVYFVATDATHGYELWRTNGTEAGTVMLGDLHQGGSSSHPDKYAFFEDHVYFVADDGIHGRELFKVDDKCMSLNIDAASSEICLGNEVELSASYDLQGADLDDLFWELGDDQTEDGNVVNYTYQSAGEYNVELTVSSSSGCESTVNTTIIVQETPQADFTLADTLCLSSISIPINITTGSNDQTTWEWELSSGGLSTDSEPEIEFTETGWQEISLTAANGSCSSDISQDVLVYSPSLEVESFAGTSCFGYADGSATLGGSSPFGPLLFGTSPETLSEINQFNDLPGGTTTFYCEDSNGCLSSIEFEIPEAPEPIASVESTDDSGSGDGTITITVTEGNPPYMFSLDNVDFQESNVFSGLSNGDYTIYIIDNNDCVFTADGTVDSATSIDLTVDASDNMYIYPNPSQGNHVTVEVQEGSINYALIVVDSQGKQVMTTRVNQKKFILDVSDLSAGLYTVYIPGSDPEKLIIKE